MAVVLGFVIHSRQKIRVHKQSWWDRNGPLLLICIAIPLILADPIRHVLQDTGAWPACIPTSGSICAQSSSMTPAAVHNGHPHHNAEGAQSVTVAASIKRHVYEYDIAQYRGIAVASSDPPSAQPWPVPAVCACEWWSSGQYRSGEADDTSDETIWHLSLIGFIFTIGATYAGFILLAIGTLWNADVKSKMRDIKVKWRQLRQRRRGPEPAASADAASVSEAAAAASGEQQLLQPPPPMAMPVGEAGGDSISVPLLRGAAGDGDAHPSASAPAAANGRWLIRFQPVLPYPYLSPTSSADADDATNGATAPRGTFTRHGAAVRRPAAGELDDAQRAVHSGRIIVSV